MSSLRTPSGPRTPTPQSVFWRRRLLLLLGLAALITVIVLIVVRPGSARSEGQGDPPPAADKSSVTGAPTDEPTGSGTPGAGGNASACRPSNVKVVAVTDAATYGANAQPQLSMSITNSGSSACTFDVGTGAQEYIVTSGSERIWDSRDCQTDPTQDVQTLEPGKTLTTQPFPWDRTRSATDTCSSARTAVIAGGASYHLGVALGEATSSTTKQFILG